MKGCPTYLTIVLSGFLFSGCSVDPVKPLAVVPDSAQLAWHEMEMNAFVHFSINTFTDKEWGYGDESPLLFAPDSLDVDQWIRLFKETGFKSVILTAKHHDGFCLWPTRFGDHSVKNSPVQIDVVKALADACKNYGLNFGIYVSPWDRNHPDYGRQEYLSYYRNQLKELFTSYGPIFEMWFDGANGGDGYYGGAKEKRSIKGSIYYEWPKTLELVRGYNPNIIFFSDAGPGVRWVGNERGIAGETNWNTITPDTLFAGKPGIESLLNSGSEFGTHWIPAETDVSIRPGWFYHSTQDSLVKSPQRLFEIYLTSVGRGSTLLLNIPPDRHGKISRYDKEALLGFRKKLDEAFSVDHMKSAVVEGESRGGRYKPEGLFDQEKETFWATKEGDLSADLTVTWSEAKSINYIVLQEPIWLGQRIRSFDLEVRRKNDWENVYSGTTIGYKRIVDIGKQSVNGLRIRIKDARECVALSSVQVF